MSSFTNNLEEDMSFERDERDRCLKMAQSDLESAREQNDVDDVSVYVKRIRCGVERGYFTLADLSTTEEEVEQLVQAGYESEARTCLELAQGMYGCSRLHLYARAVMNIGLCFLRKPKFHWFKSFLATVFCLRPRHTRQYYIACTREYLARANLSPLDIGANEAELVRLGS